ncbi:MAG: Sec-independent protein translocase protein TatB [Sphingorhabdus sp.]
MFDIASSEFLLVMLVALVVIGPKDLPRVLSAVGKWVGKARGVAAQFRSGFDEMVRQSELEELEKQWQAENDRIMAIHPPEPVLEAVVEPEVVEAAPKPRAKRKPKPKADPAI